VESNRVEDLDVVELREGIDDWPAGTEGTVLEAYEDRALVEVGSEQDADRLGLGVLVTAPHSVLRVIGRRKLTSSDLIILERNLEDR
jgi:hypothetical protein